MANELTDDSFADTVLPGLTNPLTAQGTLPTPLSSPLQVASNDPTFSAMLKQESGGRQFNKDGSVVTSPKGAVGAAQVMPGTGPEAAAAAGLPWDPARLASDPEYNKALGSAYYQKQLSTFGTPKLAAAAYNAGPSAVQAAIAKAKVSGGDPVDYLPDETKQYVANTTGQYKYTGSGSGGGTGGAVQSPSTGMGLSPNSPLAGQDPKLALAAIAAMYPQHKITPIEYDPWKLVPKLS